MAKYWQLPMVQPNNIEKKYCFVVFKPEVTGVCGPKAVCYSYFLF